MTILKKNNPIMAVRYLGRLAGAGMCAVLRRSIVSFAVVLLFMEPGAYALEAGAAKVDITAPVGTPLNGYGARMGRDSTGIHDPIWSRALFLDDGTTRLFLVSLDLVAINPELRKRVLELAPGIVPQENIILTATHTHNGHGGMCRAIPLRFVSGRFMPDVLESTASGIATSMRNAYENRRRAALGYATGTHQGLSVNRRYPGGPIDEQIGVVSVEDADGNPIAFITNFAAHPTSVGDADIYNFSADYPGFYYLEMESLLGPDCVAIFLNGAQGNQTIASPEKNSGWERTESVGRALARSAHEISQGITFSEVTLALSRESAKLPLTLGSFIQPEEVLLYSLEINDLVMSFFPGEACVELGLNLRQMALARGYAAHFSVGLSNDYIMYFVPRHLYGDLTYESSMSFFGPGMEDWFYDHFQGLMRRAVPEGDIAETAAQEAAVEEIDGGAVVTLQGSHHDIGLQRGNVFAADIQARYEQRVVQQVSQGIWTPSSGMWTSLPSFVNTPALALPVLAMGSRNLLKGISTDLIQEMEGLAEGARLPFDGLWLLQNAPLYAGINDKSLLYAAPICTMVAVAGERAGGAGIIVGRNLDWALPEKHVVTRVRPDTGHAHIAAGFSWDAGVFTAINDSGLVLSVERLQPETESLPQKAPIEFMLSDLIRKTDKVGEAVEALKTMNHVRNTHVLVAGREGDKYVAAVVELGNSPVVRLTTDGLLLGVDPDNPAAPPETRRRYAALKEILDRQTEISTQSMGAIMTGSGQPAAEDPSAIWNVQTRHSAVLLPLAKEMHLSFPESSGKAGETIIVTMPGGQS